MTLEGTPETEYVTPAERDNVGAARHEESINLVREDMNRLRGRLFEALESFGLPDQQRDAAKNIVRRLSYDMQRSLERTLRKD